MTVTDQEEILISQAGKDTPSCGDNIPCKTIGHTLKYRAKPNDVIKIDNNFYKQGTWFSIGETYPFKKNLTLRGINGMPTIFSIYSSSLKPLFLFTKEESSPISEITLSVKNIWFEGVELAKFIKPPNVSHFEISKCVYRASTTLFDSPGFIASPTSSPNSSINVRIKETIMFPLSAVISLTGVSTNLDIMDSHFKNRHQILCSTVLSLQNIPSLIATISSTISDHVLFVSADRLMGPPGNHRFIISSTVFNGSYGPGQCYTGIDASNATFIFENTSISSDLIVYNSHVIFSNCTFGSFKQAPIKPYQTMFVAVDAIFNNCTVISNVGDDLKAFGLYLDLSFGKHVKFYNCEFTNNIIGPNSVAVVEIRNGNAVFKNCNFRSNSAWSSGAVRVIDSNSTFETCQFVNNSGNYAGAVEVMRAPFQHSPSVTITFYACHFENNSALYDPLGPAGGGGAGGAISLNKLQSVAYVANCSFKGNRAVIRGGAINLSSGSLVVKSTLFKTSSGYHNKFYSGGDAIYSSSTVNLEDVIVSDLDDSNSDNSMFVSAELLPEKNDTIKCSLGKQIIFYGALHGYAFKMVNTFCSSCPPNMYSLSAGNLTFSVRTKSGYHVAPFHCSDCPLGGVCEKGRIRAADNFWGHVISNSKVRFIICPFRYCCSSTTCITYNSCHSGRNGTLCGSCNKGLTENVVTSDCLKPTECEHPWFWPIWALIGIVYVLVFMFWREITQLIKTILYPKFLTFYFETSLTPQNETPLLHAESLGVSQSPEETADRAADLNKQINLERGTKSAVILQGLFAILVNFYQTAGLYKVSIMSASSQNFLRVIPEILVAVFNLRTDGLFYQNLSWCPFESLRPVSKVFFKLSFILYLFCLMLVTYTAFYLWRLHQERENHSKPITCRLLTCSLRIILISYAAITSGLFSLVSCVPFHTSGKILFIDGSIQCYQPWQYLIMLAIASWLIPFPIGLYTSSWLLHRKKISTKVYPISLIFPLGSILYWIYTQLMSDKQIETEFLYGDSEVDIPGEADGLDDCKVSEELLDVVEGPFRKSRVTSSRNGFKLPWEAMLIARRLILIVVKTSTTDVILRIYIMLFFTVSFFWQHVRVHPFSGTVLNHLEAISLLMLTAICALNILPANSYMFPNFVLPFSQRLLKTFVNIETALMLVFPFVLGCCLVVLVCIQVLKCMIWLCSILVTLFWVCMKRKSS